MKVFSILLIAIVSYFIESSPLSSLSSQGKVIRTRRTQYTNLDASIEKLRTVARLTTGIRLQLSLVDNSVPADELISELFGFGSTTPSQIVALDPTAMKTELDGLDAVAVELNKNKNGVERIEERFGVVDEIRTIVEGVTEFKSWPEKEQFRTEINGLKTDVQSEISDGLVKHLISFQNTFTQATTDVDPNDADQQGAIRTGIIRLNESVNVLLVTLDKISAKASSTNKVFFNVEKADPYLSSVKNISSALKKLEENKKKFTDISTNEDYKTFDGNFEAVKKAGETLSSVITNLEHVETILETRKSDYPSVKLVGFPKGYTDLLLLFDDLDKPWAQQVVRTDRFEKSMQTLKSLRSALGNLNDLVTPVDGLTSSHVSEAIQSLRSFTVIFKSFGDISSTSTSFKKCIDDTTSFDQQNNINEFSQAYKDLIIGIKQLNEELVKTLEKFETDKITEKLNKVSSLCVTSKDPTQLQNNVDALKKSEEAKDLNTLFNNIQQSLGFRAQLKFDDVIDKIDNVGNYLNNLGDLAKFLSCLQSVPLPQSNNLIASFETMKTIRAVPKFSPIVDKAMTVVTEVAKFSEALKVLQAEIPEKKGASGVEVDALKLMVNNEEHSEVIGKATRGIVGMQRLIEKQTELAVIKQHATVVQNEIATAGTALSPTDTDNLKRIVSLGSDVDSMYTSLNNWAQGTSDISSTNISDYSDVFTRAQLVTGVKDLDPKLLASLQILEQLAADPANQAQIGQVKKAVGDMMSLEVDFASYSQPFSSVGNSLRQLEDFFTQFDLKTLSVPAVPSQRNNPASPSVTEPTEEQEEVTEPSGGAIVFVIIAIMLVLVLVMIGGLVYYFVVLRKQKGKIVVTPLKCDQTTMKKFLDDNWAILIQTLETFIGDTVPETSLKQAAKDKDYTVIYKHMINKYHETAVMEGNINLQEDFVREHAKETRYCMTMNMRTRVVLRHKKRFKSDFIHSNYVKMPNGLQFVLTQGPQKKKDKNRLSTIQKFWWAVRQEGAEFIVMLCQFEEMKNGQLENKCDRYFAADEGEEFAEDRVRVKCLEKEVMKNGQVVRRLLKVHIEKTKAFQVTHYHYLGWPDHSAPDAADDVLDLLAIVNSSQKPVFVHCSAGVGRSGSFAYIELAYQRVCRNEFHSVTGVMAELRKMRSDSIQFPVQLSFCLYGLVAYVCRGQKDDRATTEKERYKEFNLAFLNKDAAKK